MNKLQKAMSKAREYRSGTPSPPVNPGVPPAAPRREGGQAARGEEIDPAYSRTRRIPVNPSILKRNKVFSYFQGHPMADSLKILQTQIMSRLDALGGNTIMLTSPSRSEGKTLTAVNLAVGIAQELNRTVLLADANLRHPGVLNLLGMGPSGGLSEYLLKEAEIPELLIHPGIRKLVVLPSGRPLPQSAELLGSPRMEALVREMRDRYPERLVLFDTPSILSSADALAFSRFVDGILLVVEAERTRRDELRRVAELLEGKPVLGMVLNKTRH